MYMYVYSMYNVLVEITESRLLSVADTVPQKSQEIASGEACTIYLFASMMRIAFHPYIQTFRQGTRMF